MFIAMAKRTIRLVANHQIFKCKLFNTQMIFQFESHTACASIVKKVFLGNFNHQINLIDILIFFES